MLCFTDHFWTEHSACEKTKSLIFFSLFHPGGSSHFTLPQHREFSPYFSHHLGKRQGVIPCFIVPWSHFRFRWSVCIFVVIPSVLARTSAFLLFQYCLHSSCANLIKTLHLWVMERMLSANDTRWNTWLEQRGLSDPWKATAETLFDSV